MALGRLRGYVVGVEHWSQWVGGFHPGAYGSLVAAYEADYGITLNGANVAAWAPKWTGPSDSPAALTFAQATASRQPVYQADRGDGRPALSCATARGMAFVSPLTLQADPAELGWVLHCSANASGGTRPLWIAAAADTLNVCTHYNLVGGVLMRVYTVTGGVTRSECRRDSATISLGARTSAYWRSGTTCKLWRDGLDATTAASITAQAGDQRVNIGFDPISGESADVTISALYLYRLISESRLTELRAAVERRWPNYG